jgi:hypothetical protein
VPALGLTHRFIISPHCFLQQYPAHLLPDQKERHMRIILNTPHTHTHTHTHTHILTENVNENLSKSVGKVEMSKQGMILGLLGNIGKNPGANVILVVVINCQS